MYFHFFFFNDTATTEIYTLSLHDALPICALAPRATAHAHCDLPCGVYDPAQARIEAESVKAICEKSQQHTSEHHRHLELQCKLQLYKQVKHHLWVRWPDYFKPPHFEKYPH